MRILSIIGMAIALSGCAEIVGAAIEDHIRTQRRADEARRAQAAEQALEARDREIWDRGRALLGRAREAARAGDCRTVGRIELDVLALPPMVRLEGGFHDSVFVRDVEVLSCLDKLRLAREACSDQQAWVARRAATAVTDESRGKILETMPACDGTGAAAPVTYSDRAVCIAARDAVFARVIAAGGPADRYRELENLPGCPASSQAERANELAWAWTKSAAIAGVFGTCAPAVEVDRRVFDTDREQHDAVYLREPDIRGCIEAAARTAARARDAHERCIRERDERRRRAMAIPDVRERGRALSQLPECLLPGATTP